MMWLGRGHQRDHLIRLSIAAFVVLPLLAIRGGRIDGQLALVQYREPKLIAFTVLGWLLLAIVAWRAPGDFDARHLLRTLARPPMLALLAFVGWCTITQRWALVPANARYETRQYLLLTSVLAVFLIRASQDRGLPWRLSGWLVAAVALLTGIGWLQYLFPLPMLPPIDPLDMVRHPSLMGYKNPMALTLAAQLFLLAAIARVAKRRRVRVALLALLGLEVAYLLTLASRTAWIATAVGAGIVLVGELAHATDRIARRRVVGIAFGGVAIVLCGFLGLDGSRARVGALLRDAGSPSRYLESDRGIYFQNTLGMVARHPWGVGIGEWQTHYPVFRRVARDRWFDEHVQARRAHSDHVQLLGEVGWLGLLLWLAFWLLVLWQLSRTMWRGPPDRRTVYLVAQVLTVLVAMAGDYVVEFPSLKMQIFVLLAITLGHAQGASRARGARTDRGYAPSDRLGARLTVAQKILAVGLSVAAGSQIALGVSNLRSLDLMGSIEARRERIATAVRGGAPVPRDALEALLRDGERLYESAGHTKTRFRAHRAAAEAALTLGEQAAAARQARASLRRHPYHPASMRTLGAAIQEAQPDTAATLYRAADYVMNEAYRGFERHDLRVEP